MTDHDPAPSPDQERCGCCGKPAPHRGENDPWEGRLDGYCEDCALARCDAYPASCQPASPDQERLIIVELSEVEVNTILSGFNAAESHGAVSKYGDQVKAKLRAALDA